MTIVIVEGRVVMDSLDGKNYVELPPPQYEVSEELLKNLPESGKTTLYYFLVKVLKLHDNVGTTRMVKALSLYHVTPKMLCLADLEELSHHVRGFGDVSRKILENAIIKYKKHK